jgi:hypothetical protein
MWEIKIGVMIMISNWARRLLETSRVDVTEGCGYSQPRPVLCAHAHLHRCVPVRPATVPPNPPTLGQERKRLLHFTRDIQL